MDKKFTDLLKVWLETPADDRDYTVGNLYLLQLSGNQIMYKNNLTMIGSKKVRDMIEYQLQKFYNFRVAELTHSQVEDMAKQVSVITKDNKINEVPPSPVRGKREDHDSLPPEIQALYVVNLDILHRMRRLHMKLSDLSEEKNGKFCPDSDRYPLLKEIIALDKQLHANWQKYDEFVNEPAKHTEE